MWGTHLDFKGVDQTEESEAMSGLVVLALLRVSSSAHQGRFQVVFGDFFDAAFVAGKILSSEAGPIICRQCITIGEKPCLHGLNHKENFLRL